jgi:pimeloyl-ACP methyl ester carboxylesterase
MKVILIHGANASKVCWNWIGHNIPDHDRLVWGMMTNAEDNLARMEAQLPDQCIVVGHSMGGIYAWHLAQRNPEKVVAGISIATPWGGSTQASFFKLFNYNIPWLQTLARSEPWTTQTRLLSTPVPWTNVVCTHGFDLWGTGANDGVVTVTSQRELNGPSKEVTLDYGHNEVLQSPELLKVISDVQVSTQSLVS